MSRRITPQSLRRTSRILAAAMVFSLPSGWAMAQSVQRMDVGGYVAPRCWTLPANALTGAPAVRCNTRSEPQVAVRMRPTASVSGMTMAQDAPGRLIRVSNDAALAAAPIEVLVSPIL
jgi:hypothetical protein